MKYRRYSFILIAIIAAWGMFGKDVWASGPITQFQPFQDIPTGGAYSWKFFTIGTDHYLALASYYNGSTYNFNSKIYKWNGSSFVEFQTIPTFGGHNWEFFTIGADHYLAVTNHYNGSTYNLDSKIYKWNGSSFEPFQAIPTEGGWQFKLFTIGSDHYLAVSSSENGSTTNLDSDIYKWDGSSFVHYQNIATNAGTRWEFFTIGTDYYLAVANHHNNFDFTINSKIYKWDGSNFVEFQSISTSAAFDWEFFIIDGDYYLALANYYNNSTYNIDSKIYKWNGVNFAEFQIIPTNAASDWQYFNIEGEHYLAVAQFYDGSTFNTNSKIYRWNGTNFEAFQSIPTNGARSWDYFTIDNGHYLAVANYYNGSVNNIDSIIYRGITPEIDVLDNGGSIPDDTGVVNFGATLKGDPISKIFTVQNLGTMELTLVPPITLPIGYSLVNSFGTTTVTPTGSTTFEVQLDAPTTGSYSGTLAFANNDLDENPYDFVLNGAVHYGTYLPVIFKNYATGSDLVVENLTINSSGVVVVVKNIDLNEATTTAFRVDLYIDPSPAPTVVNQPWTQVATEGLVWNVTQTIPPGGQLALTIDDPYYEAGLSNYSGTPAAGTPIYAQVDSVNLNSTYGNVLESHEISGEVYNNITSAVAGP